MNSNNLFGASFLGVSSAISQAYNFIITIYIANILDPKDYALMGVAVLIIGLLQFVADSGFGVSIIQKKTLTHRDLNCVFWLMSLIGLLLSFVCYFSSNQIESFFEMKGVSAILRIMCTMIFLKSISIVPYKLLERELRFRTKAAIDVFTKILSLTLAAVLATMGFGVWSIVYGQIAFFAILAVLSFVFMPFWPGIPLKSNEIYSMLIYGLNIIGLRFTWYLRSQLDKIIGGKFLSQNSFGFYSLAFQISRSLQEIIHGVMNTVSVPVIAKRQHDHEGINRGYISIVKYCSILSFPLFVGGALCSEELIRALLEPKWIPAINILQVACIVQIFRLLNAANENVFIAIGKPNYSLYMNVIFGVLFAASFLIGVKWKINGMLVTWLLLMPFSYIIWTIFTLWYLKIKIKNYFKALKTSVYATIIMSIVVLFLKMYLINGFESRLLIGAKISLIIVLGSVSYIITVILKDPEFIKNIIKSVIK